MTDPVVYFGIGFFVGALIGLLTVLHDRRRAAGLGRVDQSRADVRQLEQELAVALDERSKLQCEIAVIKRDAELTWAAERVESALLRERINDVVHEVVRITQALENPALSIEPMYVYADLVIGRGRRTQTPANSSASGRSYPRLVRACSPTASMPYGPWLHAQQPIEIRDSLHMYANRLRM